VVVSVDKLKSQIASQNQEATADFEAVFQAQWSRVYGVIFRLVGDPAEAEDLALETFCKLHQNPPRAGKNVPGWLYRVATNLGLNALRSRQRREQYELQAGKISLAAASPANPALVVEKLEAQRRVRQVLAKMKPRSAKILILRHTGFSYAEVAAAVGVKSKSIGTLLSRAEREFGRRYRAQERWRDVENESR
jgi:RNA polymerase sigma-70 factor, ECF subfamily